MCRLPSPVEPDTRASLLSSDLRTRIFKRRVVGPHPHGETFVANPALRPCAWRPRERASFSLSLRGDPQPAAKLSYRGDCRFCLIQRIAIASLRTWGIVRLPASPLCLCGAPSDLPPRSLTIQRSRLQRRTKPRGLGPANRIPRFESEPSGSGSRRFPAPRHKTTRAPGQVNRPGCVRIEASLSILECYAETDSISFSNRELPPNWRSALPIAKQNSWTQVL
jgi:hypothetical protein